MSVVRFYRVPCLLESQLERLLAAVQDAAPHVKGVLAEACFNVQLRHGQALSEEELKILTWLFAETFEPDLCGTASFLQQQKALGDYRNPVIVEVGPRMAFASAWSSNAVSICEGCGISCITRIERSRRFLIDAMTPLTTDELDAITALVHDRMTEMVYKQPLTSFDIEVAPTIGYTVPVTTQGREALESVSAARGFGFDDADLDYYTRIFVEELKRDPTDVELFDIAQSNSEHSRHWFFSGKMILDGEEMPQTLFQLVKSTLPKNKPTNSVIAFHDNSSAIQGPIAQRLQPKDPTTASGFQLHEPVLHPILTAETHNFPCAVAPFPGAETGTGGRLRDVQATGRGAHTMAGISAYCVGNLHIPDYPLPWEDSSFEYPAYLASPLNIEIEASNGASDYGNKFGEPVVHGFTRSFGQLLPNGDRCEWVKPIMFSAGVGYLDGEHVKKGESEPGFVICKVGGPAYRIGFGGGAASSRVQGQGDVELDFNAVQRGDAEMENKMNRIIRACVELGPDNPIISIHDQGAGGNGNVLKEIVDPLGARYDLSNIPLGDTTMSACEIWGAEYQENNAVLIKPETLPLLEEIARRENCSVAPVGTVAEDGRVVVKAADGTTVVDLPLSLVLGKMPQKTFNLDRISNPLRELILPDHVAVSDALSRVLRLLSVGSKRFLTNKVDRSVSGCIAQQQCVGPLHTPLANCAVIAPSPFALTGVATACGEQPIKSLVDPCAGARMAVAEAVTNIMWAKVTALSDIKASGNWMWAAKLPGEGARMWDACNAMADALLGLGVSIDGGKDSLSMAAQVGKTTVKAPGMLTITAYVGCSDITKTITPDLKFPGCGLLLHIDLSNGKRRLGGSALAQVYSQIGRESPDVEFLEDLRHLFEAIQAMIDQQLIVSGHDVSDGGLIVTLLEMAFAGNCGVSVEFPSHADPIQYLFAEELGVIVEVLPTHVAEVMKICMDAKLECAMIGEVTSEKHAVVRMGGAIVLEESVVELRDVWEETSFRLEYLQTHAQCVEMEQSDLKHRTNPPYHMTFCPLKTSVQRMLQPGKPNIAILRQEGSNGDREMAAAFFAAGFEAWDVNMHDLLRGHVTLDRFSGLAFVGGFSYADVLDSGKGWAGVIRFNPTLLHQFEHFRNRSDTFSFGACNGCQLMALLGWIPATDGRDGAEGTKLPEQEQPRFIHNKSGRYESRFATVKILDSPAIMLRGMAGSSLGIWVAHGEGQAHFPTERTMKEVLERNLAPLRYVNDHNEPTEIYPFNPNGSPLGIAALCSADGRHLAMMPHPERSFLSWQWPYMPPEWRSTLDPQAGPWLKIFQNAFDFASVSNEG